MKISQSRQKSSENRMERWSALGSILVQVRRNLAQAKMGQILEMLLGLLSLKEEDFHLDETYSCPIEQIFTQASKKKLKILILVLKV